MDISSRNGTSSFLNSSASSSSLKLKEERKDSSADVMIVEDHQRERELAIEREREALLRAGADPRELLLLRDPRSFQNGYRSDMLAALSAGKVGTDPLLPPRLLGAPESYLPGHPHGLGNLGNLGGLGLAAVERSRFLSPYGNSAAQSLWNYDMERQRFDLQREFEKQKEQMFSRISSLDRERLMEYERQKSIASAGLLPPPHLRLPGALEHSLLGLHGGAGLLGLPPPPHPHGAGPLPHGSLCPIPGLGLAPPGPTSSSSSTSSSNSSSNNRDLQGKTSTAVSSSIASSSSSSPKTSSSVSTAPPPLISSSLSSSTTSSVSLPPPVATSAVAPPPPPTAISIASHVSQQQQQVHTPPSSINSTAGMAGVSMPPTNPVVGLPPSVHNSHSNSPVNVPQAAPPGAGLTGSKCNSPAASMDIKPVIMTPQQHVSAPPTLPVVNGIDSTGENSSGSGVH